MGDTDSRSITPSRRRIRAVAGVTIKRGDKVRFRWAGGSHNLIGPRARVAAQRNGTKTVTFTARGTYRYKCTLHKDMTTTVTVR